jgi:hypothetical protein
MVKSLQVRVIVAPALALCACLALGGCAGFPGYVSDHWPTWAGGLPPDVPPRPGAPGYEEFISHQEAKDEAAAAAAKPGATPAIATAPAPPAATPAVNTTNAQPMPPGPRRIDDQAAVQGGLY